jgi:hypothetical protein
MEERFDSGYAISILKMNNMYNLISEKSAGLIWRFVFH